MGGTARKPFRIQKSRTPLIATTLVLLGGFVSCVMISVPFSDDLTYPLIFIAALFLMLAAILGMFRKPVGLEAMEWASRFWEKPPKTIRYRLKRIPNPEQEEPRRPPTAETIREIRGH